MLNIGLAQTLEGVKISILFSPKEVKADEKSHPRDERFETSPPSRCLSICAFYFFVLLCFRLLLL